MSAHTRHLARTWLLVPLLLVLLALGLAACGGYTSPSNGSPSGTPSNSSPGY